MLLTNLCPTWSFYHAVITNSIARLHLLSVFAGFLMSGKTFCHELQCPFGWAWGDNLKPGWSEADLSDAFFGLGSFFSWNKRSFSEERHHHRVFPSVYPCMLRGLHHRFYFGIYVIFKTLNNKTSNWPQDNKIHNHASATDSSAGKALQ